jgi:hypothetical protein
MEKQNAIALRMASQYREQIGMFRRFIRTGLPKKERI